MKILDALRIEFWCGSRMYDYFILCLSPWKLVKLNSYLTNASSLT